MALEHLRVVEIGSSAASAYCARLFADFGAAVRKIEPPAGDPIRRAAPMTPAGSSAWFAFLNFNKASVVVDGDDENASAAIENLIRGCDVLIDGRAIDPAGAADIDLERLKRDNPTLIHIDTHWFRDGGPYENFAATDSVIRALVGLTKLVGPAEGPPVSAPDFQTGILAGLWGFIAAASSLVGLASDGCGRTQVLSVFEASIAVTEYIMFEGIAHGDVMRRIGVNRFWPTFPVGVYPTRDGWLGVTTVTPAQWRSFCEMLGLESLRDDTSLTLGTDRLKRVEEIEAAFIPKLREQTTQHWFAQGLVRRIPVVPVPSMADLINDREKIERGAVVPLQIGSERAVSPGSMQRLLGTPPRAGGAVPSLAAKADPVTHAPSMPLGEPRRRPPREKGSLPLDGVRVVDFSMGWAGPLCTRTLADLGADVIKIEAIQYPDWWRGVDRRPAYVQEKQYEKMARFCIMNRNKRGITLDLTRPTGVALAKRLVTGADIVVDNYSVDVLPKLGLGYEVLGKLNPRLVMMSMSAFGSRSVHRDCRAYGSTLEQGAGLPQVVGHEQDPPIMSHVAFGDAVGGLNGCAAVLIALINARRTGQGQPIDLAQIECMMPFTAPWMIVHSIDGRPLRRNGNRHPDHVPHGVFRCAGDDNWLAIAVSDDGMWRRLCGVIGRDDWSADPKLRLADERRSREAEIEAAISEWVSLRSADEAMTKLQRARVAAGVVRLPYDLLADQQLHDTGFIQQADRPFMGKHPQPSVPFREAAAPYPIRHGAPTLGEHNEDILCGLLGLSEAELKGLVADGIVGTEMLTEAQLSIRPK